jgi:ribosomal protein S12 methylthiotransferase
MRTKQYKPNRVGVVTLGCSKNQVDSEVIVSQLNGNRIQAFHGESDSIDASSEADVVIINTCGFIENAKEESINTILHYVNQKAEGAVKKVMVTGCLSHRYKDDLEQEIPEVDAYFGTMELPSMLHQLGAEYRHELIGERTSLTTPNHFAYLKISEGCDRPCSFCAIPLMRGGHRSKPIDDLLKEAKGLVKNGTKEIMLIAQDSTYYGLDLYKERTLAKLMKNLANVEGLDWIRLHYAYPSQFPMDVIPVIADHQNICNYIDIPVQHATDSMLKIMRRGSSKRRMIEVLDTIRNGIKDIALRTTLLVGHPGETDKDFEELCDFVKEYRFDRLGVFTYSHEDDTHSYTLEDTIPQKEKEARAAEIMKIQQEISRSKNQSMIGKELKVLIDRAEGDFYVGRSEYDSPEVDNEVIVDPSGQYLRLGDFASVKIIDAEDYDLIATPL